MNERRSTGDLVERDDEWSLARLEQVDGLYGLGLQAVHDVDDQDGNVTQRRTTAPQVAARIASSSSSVLYPIYTPIESISSLF